MLTDSINVYFCTGVMGSVEMDELGDRQTDFAVWDMMDVESGEFQVPFALLLL